MENTEHCLDLQYCIRQPPPTRIGFKVLIIILPLTVPCFLLWFEPPPSEGVGGGLPISFKWNDDLQAHIPAHVKHSLPARSWIYIQILQTALVGLIRYVKHVIH